MSALVGTSVSKQATAQTVFAQPVSPAETVGAGTSADGVRSNPALAAQLRASSIRLVNVWDMRVAPPGVPMALGSTYDATALTWAVPLPLGFGVGLGASWLRPVVDGRLAHVVSAEATAAYAISRGFSLGARARFTGAYGSGSVASLEGSAALDLALLYRPSAMWSFGLASPNLLGPRSPAAGALRSLTAGVGIRPLESDRLTVAVDGTITEALTGNVRVGAQVRVPFGRIRGEGTMDLPSGVWRSTLGVELAWGQYSLGGGPIVAGNLQGNLSGLGMYSTAGWDAERHRAIPELAQLVVVRVDDELGARGLARLLLRLERYRNDPSVRGVLFVPRADLHGLAGADELREAFLRLRSSGKYVGCHLEDAANSALIACTGAQHVAIDPMATVRTAGLRTTRFFLGDALAQLGVRTQFVRIGPWKSAAEQFTRGGSTPEALEQESSLLDSLLGYLVGRLADAHHKTPAEMQDIIFHGPYSAEQARTHSLVDEVVTLETYSTSLSNELNAGVVRQGDYVVRQPLRWAGGRSVAVLHIDGDIIDGESQSVPFLGNMVGDETLIESIGALAASDRVAAVVVRIDSPGGSASASERIWRALSRLARVKPVIASIGRIAASGGYYVAAPAREIYTPRPALVGSIGIFFGKADIAPLLTRLHIGIETSRRGEHADMDSIYRPFSEDELTIVGNLIREFYNLFLDRVSAGRHRTREQIHAIAEGRVFTGEMGLHNGLADHEGGFLMALDRARQLGGLEPDCDIVELPRADTGLIGLVRSAIGISDPTTPAAAIFARSGLARAFRWLYVVAMGDMGRPLAMSEWPLDSP